MLTSLISLLAQTADASAPAAAAAADAANAAGEATQQSGFQQYSGLIMIVLLIAVFYFLLIRPQQKKQKEIKKMREGLKEGDSVVTAGGIYGKIAAVKDTYFIVSIADNTKIKVDKGSVYVSADDAAQSQAK